MTRTTRTLVFVEGEVYTRKRLMMTAKGVFRRLGRSHENSHENSHEGRG